MTSPPRAADAPSAVLLCDGDTALADVLRRTVVDAGFTVWTVVGRWIEAVEQVAELRPDAVVVDLTLAGKAGVQLVAALHAIAPASPVMVVLPNGVMDGAIDVGAAVVVDPSDLRPLVEALHRIGSGERHVG